jgi:hypothetical protein
MNNNQMLQVELALFPSPQKSFTNVDIAVDHIQLRREAKFDDEIRATRHKSLKRGYNYHSFDLNYHSFDLDEAYPSLDVYYSLVDHGDFD